MNPIYERRILVGIASITATILLVGWLAINEDARMREFTERSKGRSIEAGARIFENNCSTCHGFEGLGTTRAPALNNPHLFGYNFSAAVDNELAVIKALLEQESDPEKLVALQVRQNDLTAERLAIQETILYDWSDKVGAVNPAETCAGKDTRIISEAKGYSEAQLCELGEIGVQLVLTEQQIAGSPGGENGAAGLSVYIQDREANELAPLLSEQDGLKAKTDPTTEEKDRLTQLESQIKVLQDELQPYKTLVDNQAVLASKQSRFRAVLDAHLEVVALRSELAQVESELAGLGAPPATGDDPNAAKREELIARSVELRDSLTTAETTRSTAYDELLANNDIVKYDPDNYDRLIETSWPGSRADFIRSTVTSGRPTSSGYWSAPMPAWGQVAGGPLRPDQVDNLMNFILNWDREFTLADLRAVSQFAKVPVDAAALPAAGAEIIGTADVAAINDQLTTLAGSGFAADAAAGKKLFEGALGCLGCHNGTTAPNAVGLWTRVSGDQDGRLSQNGFTGTPELYLVQSIAQPNAFAVPGFTPIMPTYFTTDRLTIQDLANIIAYLKQRTE